MSLIQAQIDHLGKLTALHPGVDLEISSVLDSFESLAKTDASTITSLSRSGNAVLAPREDIVSDASMADELLACSKQKKAAHQIVLGGIMIGE